MDQASNKNTYQVVPSGTVHSFDVYARPFVPEELRSINYQPATVFDTPPGRTIDYNTYAGSFIPPLFLHRRTTVGALNERRLEYNRLYPVRPISPSVASYGIFFYEALKNEVLALGKDIANHARYQVHLQMDSEGPAGVSYIMHVPGIRENSPRVDLEDVVSLRQLAVFGFWGGATQLVFTGVQYNARVHSVDRAKDMVHLRITHGLSFLTNSPIFNVCFNTPHGWIEAQQLSLALIQDSLYCSAASSANKSPKAQYAINGSGSTPQERTEPDTDPNDEREVSWLRKMLFPEESDGAKQTELTRLAERELFDPQLNFEQQKAVDSVCQHNYGEVPFLISGPPGTGKTKTIVECVLQLVSNDAQISHILLCAPSDPAADTLAQRLSQHLEFGDFIRLNAPTRTFAEVPEKLMPHCFIENNHFALPALPQLISYTVVVTSCKDAAMLVSARLTNKDLFALEYGVKTALHQKQLPSKIKLHWGALILDEAAQATEPEAAVPLSVVAPPEDGQTITSNPIFVMAGDQMQLGPRAKTAALKTSLFERLFSRPLFKDHPLARNRKIPGAPPKALDRTMLPITRPPFSNLIRNYRSHPAILAIPSALFYYDTLVPEASGTDALHSWPGWQGSGWPVLFKANTGPDEMDGEGGGWYNVAEAQMACDYAQLLVRSGLISERDVCVMSPFRAQVRVLRSMIREPPYNMWEVNIGPMEAFQGLESRVIIMCTTRTRARFLEQDSERGLGVVHEHKRFNVSLTRAKEGLVVIGNPHVLSVDPCWTAFLSFCRRHGLWADEDGSDGGRHPTGDVALGPDPESGGWQPADNGVDHDKHVSTLETGLVAKETIKRDPTADYARFMAAGTDEEMWVSGMLAAMDLDEADQEDKGDDVGEDEVLGEDEVHGNKQGPPQDNGVKEE